MKHIFYFFALILPLLLLSNSSCQKERTLENSGFTSKIDGQKFFASSNDFKKRPYEAHLTHGDSSLSISGSNESSRIGFFLFGYQFNQKIKVGEYILDNNNTLRGASYYEKTTYLDYRTSSNHKGKLTIKEINTQTKRIKGTFNFDAYNSENGKIVKITDGAFNIDYVSY